MRVSSILLLVLATGSATCVAANSETLENPSSLSQQARDLANSGELDQALKILNQLRASYPHDIDYALARAQVFARQGRDAEALDDLREALIIDPEYEDVWRLRYRLMSKQRGNDAGRQLETFSQLAATRFPDATWWQSGPIEPAARWSLLAGLGYQRLSDGLPSWNEQFFEIAREDDRRGRYRAGIARNARYDEADISVLLGGNFTFASHWLAGLAATFANNAEFQPDLEWSANVGRTLNAGWVVGLAYRDRDYQNTAVSSVTGTIEKYVGNYRIAYTVGASSLDDAPTLLNHGITLNKYFDSGSRLGITLSSGNEAEVIGPGQVLETSVRGVSLSGNQQLTDRFGLQWWVGMHDQGDYYRRDYFGLAVSIQL
ncbi:MAG: YaiO family outer membrane beta-barrel protein [Woeseiaceae bacterium]